MALQKEVHTSEDTAGSSMEEGKHFPCLRFGGEMGDATSQEISKITSGHERQEDHFGKRGEETQNL